MIIETKIRNKNGTFKKSISYYPETQFKKGMKMSKEIIKKRSKSQTGLKRSLEFIKQRSGVNCSSWKGGKPKCIDCGKQLNSYMAKRCLSCAKKKEKNHLWKGGISPINNQIRGSLEYKLWQDSILSRDGYICKKCGENRISKLVAHHILNFSSYNELRFAINNGITFCRECHKEFHKKYGKKNNTIKQIQEFLE